jgi:SAM-dependent methyltransferase
MSPDPFYTRFFPNEDSDAQAGYHLVFQARLPERGKLLDLGCGANTELARYRTERREVWGADLQRHPKLAHSEWFRELRPDGGIPFAAETFDLVVSAWVLEHIVSPVRFLAEVGRVLRPGGWFVALTPNGRHYVTWITRAGGLLPHQFTQAVVQRLYGRPHHDTFPPLYRLNTVRRLRHAGRRAGLRLTRTVGFANPDYFGVWEPLRKAAVVADWLLDGVHPGLGRLYWVASFRKPGATAMTRTPAGVDAAA